MDRDDPIRSEPDLFKGRHFDREVIVLCVRWYRSFELSSRNLVRLMGERGTSVAHTMILRWVQRYVPETSVQDWKVTGPTQHCFRDMGGYSRCLTPW